MKAEFLTLLACVGGSLVAAPLSCSFSQWDANPMVWQFDDAQKVVRTKGIDQLAVYNGKCDYAAVKVSAWITPEKAGTNGWHTIGVGMVADNQNFWHLALVKSPPDHGADHYFELCEKRDGEWLSQSLDNLRVTVDRQFGKWQFGARYKMELQCNAQGIYGRVSDSKGKLLWERGYSFTDGKPAVKMGRPALEANGELKGTFDNIDAVCANPQPIKKSLPIVSYASNSFVPGMNAKATGFFRVEQRDGKWWVFDPLGRAMVLLGVDHVTYHGHWSERTKRGLHNEVNKAKYPNKADWEAVALKRLQTWGFNMLGAGCDSKLQHRGLIHTKFLSIGDSLCWNPSETDLYICPNEHRPCSAFPNVFNPQFEAWADYVARRQCAPCKDDPWLFGYFIDNELAWWGRGASDTGLFDYVSSLPSTHSARIAQLEFLKQRGITGAVSAEVKLDFLRLAADRYFKVASSAIRRHDPNHLVMGARFAGIGGAHPAVWEVSGKYCDVVTFNCYPWADLDRNVVRENSSLSAKKVADAFLEQYNLVKRPMLITEWSFPALDSGLPCTSGAGQRFKTQKERTQATELFAKTMLALPFLVGYDYFMWVDQPAEGMSDAFPEDSNYGLISQYDKVYPEITTMFTKLHQSLGKWRSAGVPVECTDVPEVRGLSAAEFWQRYGDTKPANYETDGKHYTLRNNAGLVLQGYIGADYMFNQVVLNGRNLGTYTGMWSDKVGGGYRWANAGKVLSSVWNKAEGSLTITCQSGDAERALKTTHKITLHSNKPWFLCEIVCVENVGKKPVDINAFYFREYAPFASDKMKMASGVKSVPNLWKAPSEDAWFCAADGAYYGGLTCAPTVSMFQYHLMSEGKSQHPDATFAPREPLVMAPGYIYNPKGEMWMLAITGLDGVDNWKRITKQFHQ